MCNLWMLLGRICISALFIFAGVGKFLDPEGTAAYMQAKALPMIPVLLYAAAVIELVGGISLFLGWKTRFGATLLLIFLIPVTYIFHDFWNVVGEGQKEQMIHFFSNLAIFGGLMYVACCGGGKCSVDRC